MAKDKDKKASGRGADEHGTKGSVVEELSKIDDWEDTEEVSFSDLPDDTYEMKIANGTLNHSKSSGRLQVTWDLIVVNGDHKGRHAFKHDGLDNEQSRGFFRGSLARLGVDWPKSPADLIDVLEDLKGSYAEVKAVTKQGQDRPNYHFIKALDEKEVTDELETSTDEAPEPAKKKAKTPDPDPEPEEPDEDEDTSTDNEEGVECTFDKKAIKGPTRAKIEELAKAQKFDPADYESTVDLLADVAEYLGVTGKFDDPIKLLDTTAKKAKAKG